jgi:hypothetical protein
MDPRPNQTGVIAINNPSHVGSLCTVLLLLSGHFSTLFQGLMPQLAEHTPIKKAFIEINLG